MTKIKLYLKVGLIVLVSFATGYIVHGFWQNKYNKLIIEMQDLERKNLEKVKQIETLNRDRVRAIEEKLAAEREAAKQKEKVIVKEVIKYVETNPNSGTKLDDDWVHIHNKSVPLSRDSETASGTPSGDTEVQDLGKALEVVTENYHACQAVVDKLEAWQDWYLSITGDEK